MKLSRIIALLLVAAALLCGCSEAGSQLKDVIAGFERYESEDGAFAIQYPSDWAVVDKNTNQSVLDSLGEKMGVDGSLFKQELEQYYITIYATGEDIYFASVNIAKTEVDRRIDNSVLQDEDFQATYAPGMVTQFLQSGQLAEVIQKAQDSEFDGQYFMTTKVEYKPFNRNEGEMITYQALTIASRTMYSFNLTAPASEANFDTLAGDFEKMLGSVELK